MKKSANGHDKTSNGKGRKLRSSEWFNNPHNPGMTALYLERYLNYGLTREELQAGKRPTAALDRNLAYLGLVVILFGYPLDGVVLTTGCDKTTPACLMAAATVNMPAIVLSGGPMLNGWHKGKRTGSGTVVWKAREELAAGEIDYEEFMNIVASS